jgi:hypothetical protein
MEVESLLAAMGLGAPAETGETSDEARDAA